MMCKQTMVSWSVAGALLAISGSAVASGFALVEQNASGLGNAFAGGAAIAEDASTVFFNPAGMSRLKGK
ncbi:MAG: transporter, partial [Gallionella sp.]|nr:transporter [Gallionella sp.]